MLLDQTTLADGSRVSVRVRDDVIAEIGPPGTLDDIEGEERLDLGVRAAARARRAARALDKAIRPSGSRSRRETCSKRLRPGTVPARARAGPHRGPRAVRSRRRPGGGTTAVRSHIDVGGGIGLRGAKTLVKVRDELRDTLDIQIAALCFPLTGRDGSSNVSRLREALDLGVDVVGGAPHIDPNPRRHIELCLDTAGKMDVRSTSTWTSTSTQGDWTWSI